MVKKLNGRMCWWLSGFSVSSPLLDGSTQETRLACMDMEGVSVHGNRLNVVEYGEGDVVFSETEFDRIYESCRDVSTDYTHLKELLKREIFHG